MMQVNLSLVGLILQVIIVDLILSGDNAVVIAMACQGLPAKKRRFAIIFGITAAIAARVAMTGAAGFLMTLPFLKILGGLLLVYIAAKVIHSEDEEPSHKGTDTLLGAIAAITVADVTMSLDNVVAIAAVSRDNAVVYVIGLFVSMALMMGCAWMISSVINRYPALIWAAGAFLGWIAGSMIATDPVLEARMPDVLADWNEIAGGISFALMVLAVSFFLHLHYRRSRVPE